MEIRHLIYFAKVAELQSLTHAAAALNLSQPALGVQVRKLEEYLGVDLIERHSRGVTLTEAGRVLHRHAQRIIANFEEAKTEVRRFSKDAVGTVKVGVTPSMGRVVVPRLLQDCADRHPTLALQLTQGFTDQHEAAIHARRLDFAVTAEVFETETHESLPLYVEQFLLVGQPHIMPPGDGPVQPQDLAAVPLVLDSRNQSFRRGLDEAMGDAGVRFADVLDIEAINLRRELVLQGRRAAVATRALFQEELERGEVLARPLALPGMLWELQLTTRRVERMTQAEAAIRALLIEIVDTVVASGKVGWRAPGTA